ncbi:hypothetical protein [Streptomyces sp. NPDC006267]|uniref:hypothetical protein n=1 Tax=Streptomyces sp. NPDC006267 TaxID=3157173 RepID=UPI0033A2AC75
MTMTIKVYEVDHQGRAQVLRPETEVTPLGEPEYSHEFPACQCPLCMGGAS